MKCEQYEDLFTDFINQDLSIPERENMEQHLAACPNCTAQLLAMQQLWNIMGTIETPQPSAHLQVKFNAMLNTYKQEVAEQKNGFWQTAKAGWSRLWQMQPQWPMAYNLAILVICLGGGFFYMHNSGSNNNDKQLQALNNEVHELKQTMMLSLLENPSASERIRGVSYTPEIKHADKEVIDALLATLNNDPNVNVRLSTLDALSHLANHPEVRQGLIQSISQQDSPLMQSAIADLMLKLQEKKSITQFKELLKQKNLNTTVRDKISQTIKILI
ncbi:putative zinc finger protein [Mucilaginibacter gracilis]|uniref:Putative zinc finger protein n=1 Tax=Mucilaginibacter gracilis TaxID=423350 RepID=A0A495J9Q2_9SPHI|nr:zf-HC2 domain-containing protein [Mucilaginibacter gracilis]RKR84789.1 putative zinc finger protein [Mucilaginibacter gracilis]